MSVWRMINGTCAACPMWGHSYCHKYNQPCYGDQPTCSWAVAKGIVEAPRDKPPIDSEYIKARMGEVDHTPTGWICPVCGRGLSPTTTVCPCKDELPPDVPLTTDPGCYRSTKLIIPGEVTWCGPTSTDATEFAPDGPAAPPMSPLDGKV